MDTAHLRDYEALRRSTSDRKIAGVAGGLGRHLNIDPTVLRVTFVVLCLFGGAGFVLYGAVWLLVPEEGRSQGVVSTNPAARNVLLLVAALVTGSILVAGSWGGFGLHWPLAILALIAFAILMNRDRSANAHNPAGDQYQAGDQSPTAAPTASSAAPPAAASGAPSEASSTETDAPGPADATSSYAGGYPGYPPTGEPAGPPPWLPQAQQAQQPPAPKPDRGPRLFGITLALVAVALGLLGLWDASGHSVVGAAYPAVALTVVGVMLLVGAWFGRAGGLIFLGLLAAGALAVTALVSPRFTARTLEASPTVASAVQEEYFVPAGRIRVDLSGVTDLQQLDGRTISVRARAGDIVVVLPRGLRAQVHAHANVGDVRVNGRSDDGTSVDVNSVVGTDPLDPQVFLDLNLFAGDIEVRQS